MLVMEGKLVEGRAKIDIWGEPCPYCGQKVFGPIVVKLGTDYAPFEGEIVHPRCSERLYDDLHPVVEI